MKRLLMAQAGLLWHFPLPDKKSAIREMEESMNKYVVETVGSLSPFLLENALKHTCAT